MILLKVKNFIYERFSGIALAFLFSYFSIFISSVPFFKNVNISAIIIGFFLGIVIGNLIKREKFNFLDIGLNFCSKFILRLAIILYGFKISFNEIGQVGMDGILFSMFVVLSTLAMGFFLGKKVLKLDGSFSLLIASGSAICGAAAVLAFDAILKAKAYKVSVAVATVVVFGTISMFLYPILFKIGFFGISDYFFGFFIGGSVHEVAQVVASAASVSSETTDNAVIIKMTRVILMVPLLIIISFYFNQNKKSENTNINKKKSIKIPWFALFFLVIIVFNSFVELEQGITSSIYKIDDFLLTVAMFSLGFFTNIEKIKISGSKPFVLAFLLFLWLFGFNWLYLKIII